MWSPRAQSDRNRFSALWRHYLENMPNLYMWQDSVSSLIITDAGGNEVDAADTTRQASDNLRVAGVRTLTGAVFKAPAVVLTNGTFLNGLMHVGRAMVAGGRTAEPASVGITEQLVSIGFTADRMKTGTPVRLDGRTIDFSKAVAQYGDDDFCGFSFLPGVSSELKQRPCFTLHTSEKTHDILRRGLPDSPLYNGQIKSIGPRYCPSIETKIVTFADKTEHQLFLEPEGEDTTEYYLNGFSSSLPLHIQIEALHTIPALSDVHVFRPGYAIEYDFFQPTQLRPTLETKLVHGLFFAGQINGTTGYEEAAGQGLVAGANAALQQQGRGEFTLSRDNAYIGVLIDDLITKGVDEPYRMFTSRAEYRILLRQDNADRRLTPLAHAVGLADDDRLSLLERKYRQVDAFIEFAGQLSVKAADIDPLLISVGSTPLKQSTRLADLITRPQLNISLLAEALQPLAQHISTIDDDIRHEVVQSAEIELKYRGYIDRERQIADKMHRLEDIKIAGKFDYPTINALSTEARQKLQKIQPLTIGQASRIPGVSPADINVLLMLSGR